MLNDPKFAIVDNQLVNRTTGKPIPADMPVMIFVAKDKLAARHAIQPYINACTSAGLDAQAASASERLDAFVAFEVKNPEAMKMPDTSRPAPVVRFGIAMHACASSNLEAYGYDAERSRAALQFRGGRIYHYRDVPQHVYNGLAQAESKGAYAAREITGKYDAIPSSELIES